MDISKVLNYVNHWYDKNTYSKETTRLQRKCRKPEKYYFNLSQGNTRL